MFFGLTLSLAYSSALYTTLRPLNAIYAQQQQQQQTNDTRSAQLQPLTGVPYANLPHENPDAVEHTKVFSPPSVVKVTDGGILP